MSESNSGWIIISWTLKLCSFVEYSFRIYFPKITVSFWWSTGLTVPRSVTQWAAVRITFLESNDPPQIYENFVSDRWKRAACHGNCPLYDLLPLIMSGFISGITVPHWMLVWWVWKLKLFNLGKSVYKLTYICLWYWKNFLNHFRRNRRFRGGFWGRFVTLYVR